MTLVLIDDDEDTQRFLQLCEDRDLDFKEVYDIVKSHTDPPIASIDESVRNDDYLTYETLLNLLEDALRNRSNNTAIFINTKEREHELHDVKYTKELDKNGYIQTVITLEVR